MHTISSTSQHLDAQTRANYWDTRAAHFIDKDWRSAVCAFDMPNFYNWAIEQTQRRALLPLFRSIRPKSALDLGCGVGRWSLELASLGTNVTGIDWSAAMIKEAKLRAKVGSYSGWCEFKQADLAQCQLGQKFDFAVCVTVLQHITEPAECKQALAAIAEHLTSGAKFALLEATPGDWRHRCNTQTFYARSTQDYIDWAGESQLSLLSTEGVDPFPLKWKFLPYYRRLPKLLAKAILHGGTALSVPYDYLLAKKLTEQSWHKLMIFERAP